MDEPGFSLTDDDRKEIIMMMLDRKALDFDEAQLLMQRLLVEQDEAIHEAFDVFENNHDGSELMKALRALASGEKEEEEEEGEDEKEEEEEGEDEERSSGGAADGVTDPTDMLFVDIVESMELTEEETAALRLCVAREDMHLRAALEVFRLERDPDDLKDTLRRIARRTVEAAEQQVLAAETASSTVQ